MFIVNRKSLAHPNLKRKITHPPTVAKYAVLCDQSKSSDHSESCRHSAKGRDSAAPNSFAAPSITTYSTPETYHELSTRYRSRDFKCEGGSVTIGTGGQVFVPLAEPLVDPQLRLHTFCHAPPARWYFLGAMLSAGMSLRWLRTVLGQQEIPYAKLVQSAAEVPAGSDGLVFLPYLVGERAPIMDPKLKEDLSDYRCITERDILFGQFSKEWLSGSVKSLIQWSIVGPT
jgi:FGGY family of carbohydrate kinases, C-terminal domain